MPKFVKWVATPDELIEPFYELAPVSSSDVVYDLGSGDGRLLFTGIAKGAGKCVGIEIDPEYVHVARETAKKNNLDGKVTFIEGDVMAENLSEATVVLLYLLGSGATALRPKFESELKAGTRIVAETFPVPGWKPAQTREVRGRDFYLYVMPPERTEDYATLILETAYEDEWFYWP